MYAPIGPITPPSSRSGSLHRCIIGWLGGTSVRPPFVRGMESLREEAPCQLFGNGGGIQCLSPVLEFNLTPSGFAEM